MPMMSRAFERGLLPAVFAVAAVACSAARDTNDAGADAAPVSCQTSVITRIAWVVGHSGSIGTPRVGADGTVYLSVGTDLLALNPADGTQKWVFDAKAVSVTPVIGADGTVFLPQVRSVGGQGRVCALDPSTGRQEWEVITVSSAGTLGVGSDGTIYVPVESYGVLLALNPIDGSLKWQFATTPWNFEPGVGYFFPTPAVAKDGTVYVPSNDGNLYALNPADGSQKWAFTVGAGQYAPAVGPDGTAYVPARGKIHAVDPASGAEKWVFSAGDMAGTPAVGADGTVYAPGGVLYALNPIDGSQKWVFSAVNMANTPAIGADGTVYVSSDFGQIYALNPVDGTQKWMLDTGETANAPAIGPNGTVYLDTDYKLYALRTSADVAQNLACTPCEIGCNGEAQVGRCLPDGSGYEALETCGDNQKCKAGECVDCAPRDHLACAGADVFWVDSCGVREATAVKTCGALQECSSGACVPKSVVTCNCECVCSSCMATSTKTCSGGPAGCTSCQVVCANSCSNCGGYVASSGSCQ
jgi:outer membrane protein assembly factor BamB